MDDAPDDPQVNLLVLGRRVRALREERKLSQEQLAHAAGFHRAFVGFIERGERDFGVSHIWPLSRALNVPISVLFED